MKRSKTFYRILVAVLLGLAFAIFVIVLGALLLGCGNTAKPSGSGKASEKFAALPGTEAFNIRQVITADSAGSRTIMWQSDQEEKGAFVEYRVPKTGNAAIQTQQERLNDKFADNGKIYICR